MGNQSHLITPDFMYSYSSAVSLNFSITIGKIKQGSLSILELVSGIIVQGVIVSGSFVLEPGVNPKQAGFCKMV